MENHGASSPMKCTCFNSKHVTLYDRNYIKGKTEIKSRKVYKSLLHGAIAVRKGGGQFSKLAEPHLDYTWATGYKARDIEVQMWSCPAV